MRKIIIPSYDTGKPFKRIFEVADLQLNKRLSSIPLLVLPSITHELKSIKSVFLPLPPIHEEIITIM